jgi:hypothetical protein
MVQEGRWPNAWRSRLPGPGVRLHTLPRRRTTRRMRGTMRTNRRRVERPGRSSGGPGSSVNSQPSENPGDAPSTSHNRIWSTCTTLGDYPLGFRAAAVQPSPRHPLLWWGMNSTLLGEYRLDQHPQPHGVPSRVRNACESTYVNPTGYVSPTRSASFRTEVNDVLTWFVRLSVHVSAMRNSMGFAHPLRLCANSQFPTSGLCCDAGYATLRSIKDPLVRYRRGPFLGRHQHAALHTTPTDRLASLDRWQSSSTGTQERSGSWQSCLV